jgi:hypothetical protein
LLPIDVVYIPTPTAACFSTTRQVADDSLLLPGQTNPAPAGLAGRLAGKHRGLPLDLDRIQALDANSADVLVEHQDQD